MIFLLTRPSRDVTISCYDNPLFDRFLLTRPSRDVTGRLSCCRIVFYISTHTPLAGRDIYAYELKQELVISTHTPLAGRDIDDAKFPFSLRISTHTPLAGRDIFPCYILI